MWMGHARVHGLKINQVHPKNRCNMATPWTPLVAGTEHTHTIGWRIFSVIKIVSIFCIFSLLWKYYWNISQCNISHKVKLEEWGMNLLLSDYEADVLTIWLKARTASRVASSLPILLGILHYNQMFLFL